MKLHFRNIGEGKPLLILHGLYGASENWLSVAKALSDNMHVILPDNRNHGHSAKSESHSYVNMCEDIKELLEDLNIKKCNIVAHSMGGKTAMLLAFMYPELIEKLIIIDIAPKNYNSPDYSTHLDEHLKILNIMSEISTDNIKSYSELSKNLDKYSLNKNEKQLIAKNIKKDKDKTFKWKLNIDAIRNNLENILDFPISNNNIFNGESHFIKGEESEYIQREDIKDIIKHFPKAKLHIIEKCGHSPHRDKTQELINILKTIHK